MPLILVVQPDPARACTLRRALLEHVRSEVVVVDSATAALAVVDERVPDVILLHDLMTPDDEQALISYLTVVPQAEHVQVITIPQLPPPGSCDSSGPPAGGVRRWLGKSRPSGCVPGSFTTDVTAYLGQALATKVEIQRRVSSVVPQYDWDRRRGHRWPQFEVPWVSAVRLAAGQTADLVNISAGGSLLRTRLRPDLAWFRRRAGSDPLRSKVTFHLVTGQEVPAAGKVVRCSPRPSENGPVLYEVAFQFDESISLDLPSSATHECYETEGGAAADEALVLVSPSESIFDRPATMQNRLLERVLRDSDLPSSVRKAASDVATLNAALLEIKSTLGNARGPALLNLARVLAPRVQELNVKRQNVVANISAADSALIAAYDRRPESCSDGTTSLALQPA